MKAATGAADRRRPPAAGPVDVSARTAASNTSAHFGLRSRPSVVATMATSGCESCDADPPSGF